MIENKTVILHWTDGDGNERIAGPMEFGVPDLPDPRAADLWLRAARRRGCDYIVILAGRPPLDELTDLLCAGVPLISHPSAILLLPVGAP